MRVTPATIVAFGGLLASFSASTAVSSHATAEAVRRLQSNDNVTYPATCTTCGAGCFPCDSDCGDVSTCPEVDRAGPHEYLCETLQKAKNDDETDKVVFLANLTAFTKGPLIGGPACTTAYLLTSNYPTAKVNDTVDERCYLHLETDIVYRGSATPGVMTSFVLRRCEHVELPQIGTQYVIGMTGKCAWRKGDFLPLYKFPEAFIGYLDGTDDCPAVSYEGGGSVTLVIMLIVVFPISSIVLILGFKRFGPKVLVDKCWKIDAAADKKDGPAAMPQPPTAPKQP